MEATVTRRFVLGQAAAGSAALAATACGAAGQGVASLATEPATVAFATMTVPEHDIFRKVGDVFAQKQTKIKLDSWDGGATDFYVKVAAALAASAGPDVSFVTSRQLMGWQAKGLVMDLTTGLTRRRLKTSDWFPLAAQEWQFGGKQYGVPQGWGTIVAGINKSLVAKSGLTLKPDFDATWTHDDFVRMLKQIAKVGPDGDLTVWGLNTWGDWAYFWDFGAEVTNAEGTKCALNTAQGQAALQWIYDVSWTHRIVPRGGTYDKAVGGANMWNTGLQGFNNNGGPTVRSSWPGVLPFDFDIAYYPIGPAGRHHLLRSDGWVASRESKKPDGALDFLAWLGTDGQTEVEKLGGRQVPAYRPAAEGIFLQGTSPFTRQKWLEAVKTAKLGPRSAAFDDINASVNTHKTNILTQKESVRDAAAAIEREVNMLLATSPAAPR